VGMNVTVTILQNGRCDDYGIPLVAGSSYSLGYDRAKSLWQAGLASVVDSSVFDDDNTSNDGGIIRYLRFPGFKRSLLASLVANSTASRSNGLVTVTATGHGITTGATYQGFRFFYPGSASLTAGWYDSIISIPDANTLTFSAPGADFGNQSVNAAAAYTTLTTFTTMTLAAGTVREGTVLKLRCFRSGDTSAVTKAIRGLISGVQLGASQLTTTPIVYQTFAAVITDLTTRTVSYSGTDNSASGTFGSQPINWTLDQPVGLAGSLSAASAFVTMENPLLEITR